MRKSNIKLFNALKKTSSRGEYFSVQHNLVKLRSLEWLISRL